jgi:hypothetical protein
MLYKLPYFVLAKKLFVFFFLLAHTNSVIGLQAVKLAYK